MPNVIPETISLTGLYSNFSAKFPGEAWWEWEPETLLLEGSGEETEVSPILVDKVWILRVLLNADDPNEMLNDPVFFLHVTDVINGNVADFDYFPSPTSLEVAASVAGLKALFRVAGLSFEPGDGLKEVTARSLVEDGFETAPVPLEYAAGTSDLKLFGPTTKNDLTKAQAIAAYLKHLNLV